MKKKNKCGFTLVEIIVVVVIIAVLAAVGIPTMSGIINRAHIATCKSDRGAIRRMYQSSASAMLYKVDDPKALMSTLVNDFKGTVFSYNEYLSECGGICTIKYTKDNGQIESIHCSLHDPGEVEGENPYDGYDKDGLERALAGIRALYGDKKISDVVEGYLLDKNGKPNKTRITGSLDSNGKNFAIKMNPVLIEMGFSLDGNAWRIIYDQNKKTYEIYWTDTSMDNIPEKTAVRYAKMKYNYAENKQIGDIETGMVKKIYDRTKGFEILDTDNRSVDELIGSSWR